MLGVDGKLYKRTKPSKMLGPSRLFGPCLHSGPRLLNAKNRRIEVPNRASNKTTVQSQTDPMQMATRDLANDRLRWIKCDPTSGS